MKQRLVLNVTAATSIFYIQSVLSVRTPCIYIINIVHLNCHLEQTNSFSEVIILRILKHHYYLQVSMKQLICSQPHYNVKIHISKSRSQM